VSVVLSEVRRGGVVESRHHGSLVVVRDEQVVKTLGEVSSVIYPRSAVKPLQALPLVERGGVERFGLGDDALGLACASHDGTAQHISVVRRMLAAGGFDETALQCGPHTPSNEDAARGLVRAGRSPSRLHNNCSGKHAAFLLLARLIGADPARYREPTEPVQRAVHDAVAAMVGCERLEGHVDGCGAPALRMPLVALARGFARLVTPRTLEASRATACRGSCAP
jgi:L-asparaginase II